MNTRQTTRRTGSNLALDIGLGVAALVLFLGLLYLVRSQKADIARFDGGILRFLHGWRSPWLTDVARVMAVLGSAWIIGIVAAVAVLADRFWRPLHVGAATILLAVCGGALIVEGIKYAVHRTRPDMFAPLLKVSGYSFPSGHAFFGLVVYGLIAHFVQESVPADRKLLRFGIAAGAALLVLLIGVSRVYVGVHFPTDVLAGWSVGLPWFFVCRGIHDRRRRASRRRFAEGI